jgi:hypothetical protein
VLVEAVENAARLGQEFVVVGRTRTQSGQHGLDARRLGHRHTADIEAVNDGSDARQRRIAFQAEAGRQHFEAHAAADMGERGAVEIETERRLRTFLRSVEPEEFRLAVNETPDQPGRGHAIDPEVPARRPGPPLKVGNWQGGGSRPLSTAGSPLAADSSATNARLRLPLRLAGKIIDGDQRRQIAANSTQRLRIAGPGRAIARISAA